MTPERAKELIQLQSQWPYWGNFSKFMTEPEKTELKVLWDTVPYNTSIAGLVYRISRGEFQNSPR